MFSTGQRFSSSGQHCPPFEQLGPNVNNFTVICLGWETCVIMVVRLVEIFFLPSMFFFNFVFH